MILVTKSKINVIFIVSILILLLVSIFIILTIRPAKAAPVTGFNPGLIIDDSVFTNRNSMSVGDIQSFLNSKVPVCDTNGTQVSELGGGTRAQWAAARGYAPPFTCLKDFKENNKSSAQIIYDAAQEFSINPQVLIVLLQKEQALVTDTWPIPGSSQYKSATGYACPDTADCDSQYAGLTNQLRWSARMFRAILNNSPTWYTPYVLGNNYIRWNKNTDCGGTTVNIQNRSTQALYNYTPYQPNQAALASGYGMGDACSAYGNRNFYQYFKDWFGSTTGPDYAASFKPTVLYADQNLTQRIPMVGSKYIVSPGQSLYTKIEVTNTGRGTWNTNTNLGTANERDRTSKFQSSSWISATRPSKLTNATVTPGAAGTFSLNLIAPQKQDIYTEGFGVVQDGTAWMSDILSFSIQVSASVAPTYGSEKYQLKTGSTLSIGDTLLSADGFSSLMVNPDGKIVLRTDTQIVWTSPQSGGAGARLVMQNDGNLVLYDINNKPVWNSETSGKGTSSLSLQEDGNLVIYNTSGATWSSGTSIGMSHLTFPTSAMHSFGEIYRGQSLISNDRKYGLYLQNDGNVVLYSNNIPLWNSGTSGTDGNRFTLQADGNLVLYTKNNQAIWSSGTAGKGTSAFYVQTDGNLVIYNTLRDTWNSGTSR